MLTRQHCDVALLGFFGGQATVVILASWGKLHEGGEIEQGSGCPWHFQTIACLHCELRLACRMQVTQACAGPRGGNLGLQVLIIWMVAGMEVPLAVVSAGVWFKVSLVPLLLRLFGKGRHQA